MWSKLVNHTALHKSLIANKIQNTLPLTHALKEELTADYFRTD